jgi:hypothetical protein
MMAIVAWDTAGCHIRAGLPNIISLNASGRTIERLEQINDPRQTRGIARAGRVVVAHDRVIPRLSQSELDEEKTTSPCSPDFAGLTSLFRRCEQNAKRMCVHHPR